ncbi:MAG: hypothetical protein U0X75_02745 [Acidobacteriota bacterium]
MHRLGNKRSSSDNKFGNRLSSPHRRHKALFLVQLIAVIMVDLRVLILKSTSGSANAKTVIGSFGDAADLNGVFVNHVFVRFGVALTVQHIPAQFFKKRVKEFSAQLGFVVIAGTVRIFVEFEAFDEFENAFRDSHSLMWSRGGLSLVLEPDLPCASANGGQFIAAVCLRAQG